MSSRPAPGHASSAPHALGAGFFAQLANAIADAVMVLDLRGNVVYLNPVAEDLYGWKLSDVVGHTARKLFVSEQDAAEAARVMETLARGEAWRGDFPVLRRDGSRIVARVTNAPVRDTRGAIVAYVGISRDVTHEHETARELARTRVLLEEAQRIAGLGSYELDLATQTSTWSPRLFDIYGLDPASTTPGWDAFLTLLTPEEAARLQAEFARLLASPGSYDQVYRIRRASDGAERFIHSRGEFLRDAEGRPVRLVGTAQDVTEHELALRRAVRGEQLLAEAQALANVGSWEREVGAEVGTWSAETYRIHGVDPATFVPRLEAAIALVHPDDRTRVAEALERLMRDGHAEGSYRVVRPDGSLRYVEGRAVLTPSTTGGPPRILGVVQDITSRVEVEQALAAAREEGVARERLAALGTLVAGVAHEINNPMSYVRGNAELIALAAADAHEDPAKLAELPGEAARLTAAIVRGAEQVEHITRTLKHVARPSGGAPAPLDVLILLEQVAAMAKARVPHEGSLELECESNVLAFANPQAASQVLLNLTLNALQATRRRADARVVLRASVEERRIVVEVQDNGPGIPKEQQGKIFVPFFTTRPDGTGLGLSLSHQLAHEQGGSLTFTTSPDGTTFRLTLPRPP